MIQANSYAALRSKRLIVLSSFSLCRDSSSISKSSCSPNQNLAELPKNMESLIAVSADILLFPFIISEIRVCGIDCSLERR
jgi:hypothetical protein